MEKEVVEFHSYCTGRPTEWDRYALLSMKPRETPVKIESVRAHRHCLWLSIIYAEPAGLVVETPLEKVLKFMAVEVFILL